MRNKLIIFDLDGVIFDSVKVVEEFLFTSFPTLTRDVLNEILRGNFHEELDKFKVTNQTIEETPEEREVRYKEYALKKSKAPIFDGMKELLGKLHKAGYVLVINTSAYERNCLPLLERAGIREFFDLVATAEVSKSKVEKFRIIQDNYGLSQKDVLFITDTVGDVREAKEAKIPTIAVTWGGHQREYFEDRELDNIIAIVDSIEELEKNINNSGVKNAAAKP